LSAETAAWGYIAPQCWQVENPLCGSGTQQSPINIQTALVDPPGSLSLGLHHGTIANAILYHSGEELRVNHMHGYITYDGLVYDCKQFHFKFPSEHAIDGKIYPAELVIVHQQQGADDRNNLLVIAAMYDYGERSTFLQQLGFYEGNEALPNAPGDVGLQVGTIRLDQELEPIVADGFYNYHGSITTPPCEETVGWIVMAGILEATKAQLDVAKAIFPSPGSSRPLQKQNGRHVGKNGKPYNYPVPLPVNTWLLESQNGDYDYWAEALKQVDEDELNAAFRSTLLASMTVVFLAIIVS